MSSYSVPDDVAKIQTEIMTNGPVEAAFDVYDDFLNYKEGELETTHTSSFSYCLCTVRIDTVEHFYTRTLFYRKVL